MPEERQDHPQSDGGTAEPLPPALGVVEVAILVVAGLLLFTSLGGRLLWQDEAETALLAESILDYGVPIASDGINVVSQEASREFVSDSRLPPFLWRWSPWVQFYITAVSFALFGRTTLAARLPFAVLGLVAVTLTYLLARRLFASRAVARLSAIYLACSVPFLLHTRQARWCSPAYCLFLGFLLALEGLGSARRWSWSGLIFFGVLLFYTNYFVALGLLAAALPPLIFRWPLRRDLLRQVASAYSIIALLTLPGVFLFRVLNKSQGLRPPAFWSHLTYYGGAFSTFLLPLPALVVIVLLLVTRRSIAGSTHPTRTTVVGLLVTSALYVAYLALGPWVEFRYLTMLLPVAAILLGVMTDQLRRLSPSLGVVLFATLILTDVVQKTPLALLKAPGTGVADAFPSVGPIGFPLMGFLHEVTHHFDAPEEVLTRYLNQHAARTDVVLTTYDDLPLRFYTRLRVAGGLQGRVLPANPDWLIRRRWIVSGEPGKDNDVDLAIGKLILTGKYEAIRLPARDHMLATNPDPKHHFFVASNASPRLVVFRKRR